METLNRIPTFLFLVFIFSLVGCTESINLDLKTEKRQLVVDGVLSNEPFVQVIRLSWSVPYFTTTESPPVSGANVTVNDGDNTFRFRESTEHPGYYYILPDAFLPIPGKTYTLKIQNPDLVNDELVETYTAISKMPEIVDVDSIDLKYQYFNKDWEIWQVLVYFQDPPKEENNYMFRISQNGNRVTSRPSDIRISNDKFFDGNYVNGLWIQSIDAAENRRQIKEGDLITLELASINKEFYEFMDAVKKDQLGSDPIFSGPPANMPGNISNGALGFFTTIATSSAGVVYDPSRHD